MAERYLKIIDFPVPYTHAKASERRSALEIVQFQSGGSGNQNGFGNNKTIEKTRKRSFARFALEALPFRWLKRISATNPYLRALRAQFFVTMDGPGRYHFGEESVHVKSFHIISSSFT